MESSLYQNLNKNVYSKRLSVVIPGYNTPDWMWERCVKSVLAAIKKDDEVICVNDGSKVKPIVLDQLASLDNRICVIHKENGGLASARNAAIEASNGRYVTFVDSDDEILPETYDITLSYMKETQCDIGIFGVTAIWVDINLQKTDVSKNMVYNPLRAVDVDELYKKCLFNYACNKIYDRKQILDQTSNNYKFLFDLNGMPCEDLIFNLSLAKEKLSWCTVEYAGYIYYRYDGTILSSYKPTNINGIKKNADTWDDYCKSNQDGYKFFSKKCSISEDKLYESEWNNIWMPMSPFNLKERYKWLCKNGNRFLKHKLFLLEFLKKYFLVIARRHFYFKFIRWWHIKRLYPQVVNFK